MSKIKSLILGSAAGLVAIAGAQAADLPVKAKAVQYVKICSLYGAGFYYIPGTDTCVKIGGYAQFDVGINGGVYDNPYTGGAAGVAANQNGGVAGSSATSNGLDYGGRETDALRTRTRFDLLIDARTATEYGVVRAYNDTKFQWTSITDGVAGGNIEVDNVFVQFAGFTLGKAASAYSTPWHSVGGNNNTSSLLGGHDNLTGTPQISYTWQFGNGLSAQLGVEDPASGLNNTTGDGSSPSYDRAALINTAGITSATTATNLGYGSAYGGVKAPDINGNIRLDQAAYTVQLSGAAHDVYASYYGSTSAGSATAYGNGHPNDRWGYAVQGSFQLKNLPTGPGDKLTMDFAYSKGANRYVIGGTTGNAFDIIKGGSAAQGISADGIFATGSQIELTSVYGLRGGFVHNWSPTWESDVFGSISKVDYGTTATTLYCTAYNAVVTRSTPAGCNPDFTIYQLGTRLGWTPVQNLTFSAEALYTFIDQNQAGSFTYVNSSAPNLAPTATLQYRDLGVVSGNLRVRRTF